MSTASVGVEWVGIAFATSALVVTASAVNFLVSHEVNVNINKEFTRVFEAENKLKDLATQLQARLNGLDRELAERAAMMAKLEVDAKLKSLTASMDTKLEGLEKSVAARLRPAADR